MSTQTASSTREGVPQRPPETVLEVEVVPKTASSAPKIGLAFQGGSFLAGAIGAGVVTGLVEARSFDTYDISAFSGTSAGALVAAVCWRHALLRDAETSLQAAMAKAPDTLRKQWLHNAYGTIPNQEMGDALKLIDYLWSTNPIYFLWKENISVKWLHRCFLDWVDAYVEPETCMGLLYDKYLRSAKSAAELEQLQRDFNNDETRPRLIVGATRVDDSESVNITDQDFFAELVKAWTVHKGVRDVTIRAAADYMRLGIMASGSLDSINGTTTIKEGRHAGTYLDGAWAENPPLKELLGAKVDQIWMVEVFPKQCSKIPDTFPEREDRREELWQNSVVEQQLAFIRKVNLWLECGRLIADSEALEKLRKTLRKTLENRQSAACQRLMAVFKESEDDWGEAIDNDDKIVDALVKPYRYVEMRRIELPVDMQPLTAGARLVNSREFLIEKIELGRANILLFLATANYQRSSHGSALSLDHN